MRRTRQGGSKVPEDRATPLARLFPEKTVTVRGRRGVRCWWLSPRAQAAGVVVGVLGVAWLIVATSLLALQGARLTEDPDAAARLTALYGARIAGLESALAEAETGQTAAQARAAAALADVALRHDALAEAAARAEALAAENAALLEAAATAASARADALASRLVAVEAQRDEMAETLMRIAASLDATAVARDDAEAAARDATGALDMLAEGVERQRDRQAQLLSEVEKAAELSLGPLESMLRDAGLDVDRLVSQLRREYDGAGGPFIPAPHDDGAEADQTSAQAATVLAELNRVRLLRAAAERLPFAVPVRAPRYTSGFGVRNDPFGRGRARHEGLDMSGPAGTPVLSAAAGVVAFAGTERGYGRVIRIRHDFGFETVYAHLSRFRVAAGQRVAAGARIGDMGSTGRSSGSHLHYEIRVNGRPVNPMKFIEAARDVL